LLIKYNFAYTWTCFYLILWTDRFHYKIFRWCFNKTESYAHLIMTNAFTNWMFATWILHAPCRVSCLYRLSSGTICGQYNNIAGYVHTVPEKTILGNFINMSVFWNERIILFCIPTEFWLNKDWWRLKNAFNRFLTSSRNFKPKTD
jgi:hypothetical protein